ANANRRRQQAEAAQLEQASQVLLEDVQSRRHVWSKALRRPEFAGYMLQVESILRDWSAGYPSAKGIGPEFPDEASTRKLISRPLFESSWLVER
ncbi:hypothetical protein OAS39_07585, partial [Pirellulales bacterium]|nr:hypothetical protein [Pirellulales bacterium]